MEVDGGTDRRFAVLERKTRQPTTDFGTAFRDALEGCISRPVHLSRDAREEIQTCTDDDNSPDCPRNAGKRRFDDAGQVSRDDRYLDKEQSQRDQQHRDAPMEGPLQSGL